MRKSKQRASVEAGNGSGNASTQFSRQVIELADRAMESRPEAIFMCAFFDAKRGNGGAVGGICDLDCSGQMLYDALNALFGKLNQNMEQMKMPARYSWHETPLADSEGQS